MFTMRLNSGAPIYEQLEQRITELIMKGEMKENERLPAVREIAKVLLINPNTVQKTYVNLETRGLIYSIPAKGSYVSAREKYYDRVISENKEAFLMAVKKSANQGLSEDDLHNLISEYFKGESESK